MNIVVLSCGVFRNIWYKILRFAKKNKDKTQCTEHKKPLRFLKIVVLL